MSPSPFPESTISARSPDGHRHPFRGHRAGPALVLYRRVLPSRTRSQAFGIEQRVPGLRKRTSASETGDRPERIARAGQGEAGAETQRAVTRVTRPEPDQASVLRSCSQRRTRPACLHSSQIEGIRQTASRQGQCADGQAAGEARQGHAVLVGRATVGGNPGALRTGARAWAGLGSGPHRPHSLSACLWAARSLESPRDSDDGKPAQGKPPRAWSRR